MHIFTKYGGAFPDWWAKMINHIRSCRSFQIFTTDPLGSASSGRGTVVQSKRDLTFQEMSNVLGDNIKRIDLPLTSTPVPTGQQEEKLDRL